LSCHLMTRAKGTKREKEHQMTANVHTTIRSKINGLKKDAAAVGKLLIAAEKDAGDQWPKVRKTEYEDYGISRQTLGNYKKLAIVVDFFTEQERTDAIPSDTACYIIHDAIEYNHRGKLTAHIKNKPDGTPGKVHAKMTVADANDFITFCKDPNGVWPDHTKKAATVETPAAKVADVTPAEPERDNVADAVEMLSIIEELGFDPTPEAFRAAIKSNAERAAALEKERDEVKIQLAERDTEISVLKAQLAQLRNAQPKPEMADAAV
jgi:hypothetical protein